jgi:hypothetical protein
MQEYALSVGEELVIGGGIRLTVLAVEAGEVLLGLTAPEPGEGAVPEARQRRPPRATTPAPWTSDR